MENLRRSVTLLIGHAISQPNGCKEDFFLFIYYCSQLLMSIVKLELES